MDNEILQEIKNFLKKDVKLEDNLRNLGIDSLDLLDLVVSAEEKYSIQISDEELLDLKTIQDLVNVIKTKNIK